MTERSEPSMVPPELRRTAPAGALATGASCPYARRGALLVQERTCGAAPLPCRITGQGEAVWRQVAANTRRRAGAAEAAAAARRRGP